MRLSNAIEDYSAYLRHEQGVTKSTWHSYTSYLHGFQHWLTQEAKAGRGEADPPIQTALTTDILRRYLYSRSAEGLRPRTIHGVFFPIKGIIRFLMAQGALSNDPMRSITLPKKDDPIRHTVSDADCVALLAACDRLPSERRARWSCIFCC